MKVTEWVSGVLGCVVIMGVGVGCDEKATTSASAEASAKPSAPNSSAAKPSPSASATPVATASAAASTSAAPSASAAAVVPPPTCPAGFTGHGSPAFCIKLAKDYSFGSEDKNSDSMGTINFSGAGTVSIFYSDATLDVFVQQAGATMTTFKGDQEKHGDIKNGKWTSWVSKDELHYYAMIAPAKLADGKAVTLQCNLISPQKKPHDDLIDMCKSLSLP